MYRLYGRKDYWESRYLTCSSTGDVATSKTSKGGKRKRGKSGSDDNAVEEDVTSEWYFGWADVAPLLTPLIKRLPKEALCLDLGMGLSSLFADLLSSFEDKRRFVGVDYVKSVVEYRRVKSPGLQFHHLDATSQLAAHFGLQSVDFVLDKATTDGLLCGNSSVDEDGGTTPLRKASRGGGNSKTKKRGDEEEEGLRNVKAMYTEVSKILKPGGVIVMITVNSPADGWFMDCVISPLTASASGTSTDGEGQHHYTVSVNLSEDNLEEGEEVPTGIGSPKVIVIRKSARGGSRRGGGAGAVTIDYNYFE